MSPSHPTFISSAQARLPLGSAVVKRSIIHPSTIRVVSAPPTKHTSPISDSSLKNFNPADSSNETNIRSLPNSSIKSSPSPIPCTDSGLDANGSQIDNSSNANINITLTSNMINSVSQQSDKLSAQLQPYSPTNVTDINVNKQIPEPSTVNDTINGDKSRIPTNQNPFKTIPLSTSSASETSVTKIQSASSFSSMLASGPMLHKSLSSEQHMSNGRQTSSSVSDVKNRPSSRGSLISKNPKLLSHQSDLIQSKPQPSTQTLNSTLVDRPSAHVGSNSGIEGAPSGLTPLNSPITSNDSALKPNLQAPIAKSNVVVPRVTTLLTSNSPHEVTRKCKKECKKCVSIERDRKLNNSKTLLRTVSNSEQGILLRPAKATNGLSQTFLKAGRQTGSSKVLVESRRKSVSDNIPELKETAFADCSTDSIARGITSSKVAVSNVSSMESENTDIVKESYQEMRDILECLVESVVSSSLSARAVNIKNEGRYAPVRKPGTVLQNSEIRTTTPLPNTSTKPLSNLADHRKATPALPDSHNTSTSPKGSANHVKPRIIKKRPRSACSTPSKTCTFCQSGKGSKQVRISSQHSAITKKSNITSITATTEKTTVATAPAASSTNRPEAKKIVSFADGKVPCKCQKIQVYSTKISVSGGKKNPALNKTSAKAGQTNSVAVRKVVVRQASPHKNVVKVYRKKVVSTGNGSVTGTNNINTAQARSNVKQPIKRVVILPQKKPHGTVTNTSGIRNQTENYISKPTTKPTTASANSTLTNLPHPVPLHSSENASPNVKPPPSSSTPKIRTVISKPVTPRTPSRMNMVHSKLKPRTTFHPTKRVFSSAASSPLSSTLKNSSVLVSLTPKSSDASLPPSDVKSVSGNVSSVSRKPSISTKDSIPTLVSGIPTVPAQKPSKVKEESTTVLPTKGLATNIENGPKQCESIELSVEGTIGFVHSQDHPLSHPTDVINQSGNSQESAKSALSLSSPNGILESRNVTESCSDLRVPAVPITPAFSPAIVHAGTPVLNKKIYPVLSQDEHTSIDNELVESLFRHDHAQRADDFPAMVLQMPVKEESQISPIDSGICVAQNQTVLQGSKEVKPIRNKTNTVDNGAVNEVATLEKTEKIKKAPMPSADAGLISSTVKNLDNATTESSSQPEAADPISAPVARKRDEKGAHISTVPVKRGKGKKGNKTEQKPGDDDHITIWHKEERRKIAGNAAPLRRNLCNYLKSHPDREVYTDQDKSLERRKTDSAHVTLWDPINKRKIAGNAAPLAKNLKGYLKKKTHLQVYRGQDKPGYQPLEEDVSTETKIGAPIDQNSLTRPAAAPTVGHENPATEYTMEDGRLPDNVNMEGNIQTASIDHQVVDIEWTGLEEDVDEAYSNMHVDAQANSYQGDLWTESHPECEWNPVDCVGEDNESAVVETCVPSVAFAVPSSGIEQLAVSETKGQSGSHMYVKVEKSIAGVSTIATAPATTNIGNEENEGSSTSPDTPYTSVDEMLDGLMLPDVDVCRLLKKMQNNGDEMEQGKMEQKPHAGHWGMQVYNDEGVSGTSNGLSEKNLEEEKASGNEEEWKDMCSGLLDERLLGEQLPPLEGYLG